MNGVRKRGTNSTFDYDMREIFMIDRPIEIALMRRKKLLLGWRGHPMRRGYLIKARGATHGGTRLAAGEWANPLTNEARGYFRRQLLRRKSR